MQSSWQSVNNNADVTEVDQARRQQVEPYPHTKVARRRTKG